MTVNSKLWEMAGEKYFFLFYWSKMWNAGGGGRVNIIPFLRFFVKNSNLILHISKISVPGGEVGGGGVCKLLLKFLADISFFVSQPLNDSNFWTTCPSWMNKLFSLERNYLVFIYYAFHRLSCDIFADICSFLSVLGKIHRVASFNFIQPNSMFLVYIWPIMCYQYEDLSKEQ